MKINFHESSEPLELSEFFFNFLFDNCFVNHLIDGEIIIMSVADDIRAFLLTHKNPNVWHFKLVPIAKIIQTTLNL